ncbi:MAG TPA: hypothetical protein VFK73_05605, partial [Paludibacter sp.]|nr:hypothetical protein [Paludibacter sp.]
MKTKKNNRILIILLLISIVAGLVCNYFYETSPKHAIRAGEFQKQLKIKEDKAAKTLDDMKEIIVHSSKDSLIDYPFENNDISYYVFENNELIFWSDNNLDISNISLPDSTDWHYVQLPNAHCVSRLQTFDSYKFLALIKIKNNYPYENDELKNDFASGFNIDKEVMIANGKSTDKHAIFCSHGSYIFTLSEPQVPIYNETWSQLGLVAYSLAFLLFFILFARSPYLFHRKTIPLKTFLYIFGLVGFLTGLCLFFNFPSVLFQNKLFSPFQYASNPFLASISHLTIATGFIISCIYLFYTHTNTDSIKNTRKHWIFLLVFCLYFVLVYYVFSGLIYHSSIQLSILRFNDFSFISIWIHFLILLWGIGLALLFFKTHNWFNAKHKLKQAIQIDLLLSIALFCISFLFFREDTLRISISFAMLCAVFYLPFRIKKHKNIYTYVACWTLLFTGFVVINSSIINNNKKSDKYKILAQNISINGNTDN